MSKRPFVLSIAGFDPSGGAGLLADCKTFECLKVQGFGVCTALTAQTEDTFFSIEWVAPSQILAQLLPLLEQYPIAAVKIGLVESLDILATLLDILDERDIPVVWDPVLRSSSGFDFHSTLERTKLLDVLPTVTLVTPNLSEMYTLDPKGPESLVQEAPSTSILLKGGHVEGVANDILYQHNHRTTIAGNPDIIGEKHGSGCVLSSAIASYLARGEDLVAACYQAKLYIEQFIGSNDTLLGYHAYEKTN